MTYPRHWLLQFGGSLGLPEAEHWSCGIRMSGDDVVGITVDEEQYLDDTAVPALQAWIGRPASKISGGVALDFAKFNEIDPNGRYAQQGVVHERHFQPRRGVGESTLPWQSCMVVTWGTNAGVRGPATRGRIYQPLPAVTVSQTEGVIGSSVCTGIADSARQLCDNLDAALGFPSQGTIRPCIVSNLGSGTKNQIDFVTVDNRVDVQRRRANQTPTLRVRADIEY